MTLVFLINKKEVQSLVEELLNILGCAKDVPKVFIPYLYDTIFLKKEVLEKKVL